MILNDKDIRKYCLDNAYFTYGKHPLISPFSEGKQGDGIISYGLTSAGYDLRLDKEIWVFKNTSGTMVDPKKFKDLEYKKLLFDIFIVEFGQQMIVPGHSYVLVQSFEKIYIPRNIKGRCVGKSTLARMGVIVNTTPMEPLWTGHLTIEISNSNPCPVCLYPGEGIAQLEFEQLTGDCEISYADKGGKYQDQKSVTPAIVK